MTDSVAPRAASDPLVLAIDVGTSSVRALVYDGQGRPVQGWEAHCPYEVDTTADGGVTVPAGKLTDLVCQALDEVLHIASRAIALVACDTFWHSLLGVDASGKPLTPVLTWADTRAADAAADLSQRLNETAVHERTGCGLHPSYWPAKLLWLSQSQPLVVRRVTSWLSFGEYLYLQLFGARRVSISMASGTGLLDQNSCTWDHRLLSALPLDPNQLSELSDLDAPLTGLRPPWARRWPSLASVPWYLALGDGACNNVGSGGVSEDWPVAMIGTSGALRVVRRANRVAIPHHLWTYHVDRRRFVQGGALSAGGNLIAWLETMLRLGPIGGLQSELAGMAPDGHGLTVLPFIAGERSPDWDPNARAAYVGMSLNTQPIDLVRASLEAVAYRFGLVYDILSGVTPSPKGIIASGAGLTRSPVWMQILSDVLGQRVVASSVPEATSRGAALLALEVHGDMTDLNALPPPLGTEYAPNPDRTAVYRAAMQRQGHLFGLLYRGGGHEDLGREGAS